VHTCRTNVWYDVGKEVDAMRRNATETATLDGTQQAALDALAAGQPDATAAAAAGVHRATVNRWLAHDPVFQASLNAARRALQVAVRAQLEHLAEDALGVVAKAVRAGDVKAALAVLTGLGVLDGRQRPIPSDDPVVLARKAEVHARYEALQ